MKGERILRPKKSQAMGTGRRFQPGTAQMLFMGFGGSAKSLALSAASTWKAVFLPAATASTTLLGPFTMSPLVKMPSPSISKAGLEPTAMTTRSKGRYCSEAPSSSLIKEGWNFVFAGRYTGRVLMPTVFSPSFTISVMRVRGLTSILLSSRISYSRTVRGISLKASRTIISTWDAPEEEIVSA